MGTVNDTIVEMSTPEQKKEKKKKYTKLKHGEVHLCIIPFSNIIHNRCHRLIPRHISKSGSQIPYGFGHTDVEMLTE